MHRRLFLAVIKNSAAETGSALSSLPVELHPIAVSRIVRCAGKQELDAIARGLPAFDWVLLSSANAATIFFDLVSAPSGGPAPKIACVGPDTAACVEKLGYAVDFVARDHRGDAFAEEFIHAHGSTPISVLLPRPEKMGSRLVEILAQSGVRVTQIVLYRTEPMPLESLPDIKFGKTDLFAFLSPSGVRHFFRRYSIPAESAVFAIGPTTADALEACGHRNVRIAEEFSRNGLVDAVRAFLDNESLPKGETV